MRRSCQYCHEPLGRLASLLRIQVACATCAYRMSMGGSPRRPQPTEPRQRLAAADREWTEGYNELADDRDRLQARLDTAVEEIAAMRLVVEVASVLLRLKDGPRDAAYEAEKPIQWAKLRAGLDAWRAARATVASLARLDTGQTEQTEQR